MKAAESSLSATNNNAARPAQPSRNKFRITSHPATGQDQRRARNELETTVPPLRLLQDHPKVAPHHVNALHVYAANHPDLRTIRRCSKILAVDPKGACSVVNLEETESESANRFCDATTNGNFSSGVTAWIAVDPGNAFVRWTRCQNQRTSNQSEYGDSR